MHCVNAIDSRSADEKSGQNKHMVRVSTKISISQSKLWLYYICTKTPNGVLKRRSVSERQQCWCHTAPGKRGQTDRQAGRQTDRQTEIRPGQSFSFVVIGTVLFFSLQPCRGESKQHGRPHTDREDAVHTFMRLAEHLTAVRACCKQCLPGW